MKSLWLPLAAVLALATAGFAFGFGQHNAQAESPPTHAERLVTTEAVQRSDAPRLHRFHGVVQPVQHASLAFTEGGRLVSRPAQVGQSFKRGDVIARLDARAFNNAIAAASAGVEELDATRRQLVRDDQRVDRLYEQGAIPDAEREQSRAGLERVEAMRRAATVRVTENRRRLEDTTLRAPFDGVVTQVFAEPGEMVGAGHPVVMLAGQDGYEVTIEVPAALASKVETGADVQVLMTGASEGDPLARKLVSGQVRSVAHRAARVRGLYPVVIDVSGDEVRAGLGVEITYEQHDANSLMVPLSAVLDPSGRRPYVWRIVEGRAERAHLRLGRLVGDRVEVLDGLVEGSRIATRGHLRLLAGDIVKESVQ